MQSGGKSAAGLAGRAIMEKNQSRRNLIKFIPGALLMLWATRGNAAALARSAPARQNPPVKNPPNPPYPFDKDGELKVHNEILGSDPVAPATPAAPRKDLKADDKDIHKQVALLAQYADDLKKEVEKIDSTKVLSVGMLRKTQSIEKLAHHIASLASS
jgi:hypothetical protein